jgi:transposase-like protein
LLKGEKTLAEVSRELDIQPSAVRQWKRRFEAGATAAVATKEDVVPVSALRKPISGFASSSGYSARSR